MLRCWSYLRDQWPSLNALPTQADAIATARAAEVVTSDVLGEILRWAWESDEAADWKAAWKRPESLFRLGRSGNLARNEQRAAAWRSPPPAPKPGHGGHNGHNGHNGAIWPQILAHCGQRFASPNRNICPQEDASGWSLAPDPEEHRRRWLAMRPHGGYGRWCELTRDYDKRQFIEAVEATYHSLWGL